MLALFLAERPLCQLRGSPFEEELRLRSGVSVGTFNEAIRIAQSSRDRFGAVLSMGVGALLFWHVFFNLGMVTGMLPVVGVTLPLFSYGGSSVMTVMIGLGLLMNVSVRRYQLAPRM